MISQNFILTAKDTFEGIKKIFFWKNVYIILSKFGILIKISVLKTILQIQIN